MNQAEEASEREDQLDEFDLYLKSVSELDEYPVEEVYDKAIELGYWERQLVGVSRENVSMGMEMCFLKIFLSGLFLGYYVVKVHPDRMSASYVNTLSPDITYHMAATPWTTVFTSINKWLENHPDYLLPQTD